MMVVLVQLLQPAHVFAQPGCADGLAHQGQHVLLVDGEPVFHPVAVVFKQNPAVIDKFIHRFPAAPASLFRQRRGQIEVEDGHKRLDAVLQAGVDQVAVKGDPLWIHFAHALGQDARPGNGEAVFLEAHFRHERNVFFVAVIVVGTHVQLRRAFRHFFYVLHGEAFAVLPVRAFHLVR